MDSKNHWPGLIAVFLFAVLAGVFKTAASTLWGKAVDFGVGGEINPMLISAGIMAIIILLDAIRTAVHYKIIGHTTEGMFLDFRVRAFEKINKGDVSTLEQKFRTGDTATRINSDIDGMSNFIAGDVSNFLRLIFQGIFAIVGCIFLSWQLSVAYLVLLPISIWLVKKISKPIQAQKKKSMDSTGSAVSLASDVISGILTVKSFGIQNEMNKRFAQAADKAYDETVKTEKIGMAMTGIKYTTSVIQLMALFLIGAALVSNGYISIGSMVAFVTLSAYINEPFSNIDYMIRCVRGGVASAQRLYEVYDIPNEKNGVEIAADSNADSMDSKDLTFSYSENEDILKNVTVKVKQNQKIALVGPSGCGKSTLIKLVCRFYLPSGGDMKLFGTTSQKWNGEALRKNMALVTQESMLFDGSIYENITYGREDTTRQDVENVLNEVGLWEFISSLPGGMDYEIGEFGGALSGGQKQRICIARAMVKNASLILLDEATSALDTQSEHEVQTALEKLLVNCSAIIVAHRLTTVQDVDYIYYFEDGCVVEEGTPTDLLELKGHYYNMCLQQGLVTKTAVGGGDNE